MRTNLEKIKKHFPIAFLSLTAMLLNVSQCMAQDVSGMENFMRQSGKIYVVIAVVAIIFLGLIFYLVKLDKKIGELEKKVKK